MINNKNNSVSNQIVWRRRLVSIAIVIPTAFMLGILTSYGQAVLPSWIHSIANSTGGWSMAAFALVWIARCRPTLGAFLGLATFLLLNVGYAVTSYFNGAYYSLGLDNIFILLSFVAGPIVGLSASILRNITTKLTPFAVAVMPAVLIGEGFYGLTEIADSTSPVYWTISILAGLVFIAVNIVHKLQTVTFKLAGILLSAIGAALFFMVYKSL